MAVVRSVAGKSLTARENASDAVSRKLLRREPIRRAWCPSAWVFALGMTSGGHPSWPPPKFLFQRHNHPYTAWELKYRAPSPTPYYGALAALGGLAGLGGR
jgi:hypothetical protein